jgi:hypothetical protein
LGAVKAATDRLAALCHGPRLPDVREPYFAKPPLLEAIGDFQAARGLRQTQAIEPDDATDKALREAIAAMARANDAAFRAAHERLARNQAAAEARRKGRDARADDDRPAGLQRASFGADDFSGYGPAPRTEIENPSREPAPPPDTYLESDREAPTGDTADDANRPPFWDRVLGADPDAPPKRSGPTPSERGYRPDKDDPNATAPADPNAPAKPEPNDDKGSVTPVLDSRERKITAPATEAERKEREAQYRAAFRDNSHVSPDDGMGIRSVKKHLAAAKNSGIALEETKEALRINLYSTDPPNRMFAAADAINELVEL